MRVKMKIMVEIQHPAHAHQFRYFIDEMGKKGHGTHIITTDKEITLNLLDSFGLEYDVIGTNKGGGFLKKIYLLSSCCFNTYKLAIKSKPDMFISRESPVSGLISRLLKKPHIGFSDTDHVVMLSKITNKLTDVIITPSCYEGDLGKKQIRLEGYKELMYLHPNYFVPNPNVLNEIGLSGNDRFIILRFVSWQAYHDVGQHGIKNKYGFVKELENYGRVFITSEFKLDSELEKYSLNISADKLHDLLYYATLYIGEGGTTAVESAVLGTPSLFISSLSGTMGNFRELEEKYGLLFSFRDEKAALSKAIELLQQPAIKDEMKSKRDVLLSNKIDVTKFMADFVDNYFKILK
jgi:hypothetical protein